MILGVDVSSYQTSMDYDILYQNGIRFVIIKATQGDYRIDKLLYSHVAAAEKAGMVIGLYHWCDPGRMDGAQADFYQTIAKDIPYSFTALDVEQYWTDWSTWPKNPTIGASPERISSNALVIANTIKKSSNKPVIIYTRPTFIMDYAMPMLAWINKFPTWYATYPYKAGRETLTWEAFAKRLPDPTRTGPFFPARWPADKMTWSFWQFTGDKFTLPGCSTPLDVNYFKFGMDELRVFCGLPSELPPPVVIPPTVPALTIEQRLERLEAAALAHDWLL